MRECPYCEETLESSDTFGRTLRGRYMEQGEILQCVNEECPSYQSMFHYFYNNEYELIEGYPC